MCVIELNLTESISKQTQLFALNPLCFCEKGGCVVIQFLFHCFDDLLFATRVTAEALEDAMVVGPRQEASLFAHRDKFELVAIYDSSSSSFAPEPETSPISILFRIIFEQAFKKMLKRMPMLLVGGIQAWKKEFGSSALIRGPGYRSGVESQSPAPISISTSVPKSTISIGVSGRQDHNPFLNGTANIMTSSSTGTASSPSDLHATKSGIQVGHHVTISTDQPGHSRSVMIAFFYFVEKQCLYNHPKIACRCYLLWILYLVIQWAFDSSSCSCSSEFQRCLFYKEYN